MPEIVVGNVNVFTTEYRGHTPEEIAERALDKLIYVGKDSHPAIIEQAKAFKDQIRTVLIHYINEAQAAERTTICGHLIRGGHTDLAELIRSI